MLGGCVLHGAHSLVRATTSALVQPVRYTRRTARPPYMAPPKYSSEEYMNFISEENKRFIEQYAQQQIRDKSVPIELTHDQVWTPTSKRTGLLVRKIGQQPHYYKDGTHTKTTMLQVLDNHVISYLNPEEWYNSSIVGKRKAFSKGAWGCMTIGVIPGDPMKFTAEYLQKFVAAGCAPKHRLASFMVTHDARLPPGTRLYAKHFRVGDHVDITGKTIDWGFEGAVHRWGMRGMMFLHGQNTKTHRRMGAAGTGGESKVWPGKKMPGHMGWEWRQTHALQILRINHAAQVIYVKGVSVPGETGDVLLMSDSWINKKHPENAPFPTYIPAESENPLGFDEEYYEKLWRWDEPSLEFDEGSDEAYLAALRRAQVKKQAKAKRK